MYPRHKRNVAALPRADFLGQRPHLSHKLAHQRRVLLDFVLLEIEVVKAKIQLQPIGPVAFQHLADDGQLVLLHGLLRVVVTPLGPARVTNAHRGPALFLEPPRALASRAGRVLELEAGKDLQPRLPAALNDGPQLVGTQFLGHLDHPHDPPVDVVFPHFFSLPHHAGDLTLVKEDVAITQSQNQQIHARTQHLIYRPVQKVAAGRWFESLGVKVVRVIVVDQTGAVHS